MTVAPNGAMTGPHHRSQSAASTEVDDDSYSGSRLIIAKISVNLAIGVVGSDPT